MIAPHKTLDGGHSENDDTANKASSAHTSVSHDGPRGGQAPNLHSMTFSAASFVDLRMTRPPEGMRPKHERGNLSRSTTCCPVL